jgi:hypothetical protein
MGVTMRVRSIRLLVVSGLLCAVVSGLFAPLPAFGSALGPLAASASLEGGHQLAGPDGAAQHAPFAGPAGIGGLPFAFEANAGQTDSRVRFLSRTPGYTAFLTPDEVVLTLRPAAVPDGGEGTAIGNGASAPGASVSGRAVVRLRLVGADPASQATGSDVLPGRANYVLGRDPAGWRADVPMYARVVFAQAYPGVDVVYYGSPHELEYDFVVAPGADPGQIALEFEGVEALAVDEQGDLILRTAGGELRQRRPYVYQESGGARHQVAGEYVLQGERRAGFALGVYDPAQTLVIDPVLVSSTYLGGNRKDRGYGIALDGTGNIYVTGRAESANFPVTAGAFDTTLNSDDAFVAKLNPAGSALVYSTYLGGENLDAAAGIAVDGDGNAYVTGTTVSQNFPVANAVQAAPGGASDAFVVKLNPAGNGVVYATRLGGRASDGAHGIAVDAAGSAYVVGQTSSGNFPTVNPLQPRGSQVYADAFVAKLNPAGSALVYSTFLGGSATDRAFGIALDAANNAYVAGETESPNFPVVSALQTALSGGADAFVAKLNPAGSALVYSTYLGGADLDRGRGVAVDSAGNAHVTGETASANFPTAAAVQATFGGERDAFVTKLNATGAGLVYSTFLGGIKSDRGRGIAVSAAGDAYVTGRTTSTNFPTANAVQPTHGGGVDDVFVTKLGAANGALAYSTFLGGRVGDVGRGIVVDSAGSAYVTGETLSPNFPTLSPAQPALGGHFFTDAFVTRIGP